MSAGQDARGSHDTEGHAMPEQHPPGSVAWAKGGSAQILSVADDAVVLRSTVPSPPGARLEGTVVLGDAPPVSLKVKVHTSKRERDAEGSFVITGRLLDASRTLREQIVAVCKL